MTSLVKAPVWLFPVNFSYRILLLENRNRAVQMFSTFVGGLFSTEVKDARQSQRVDLLL